jgi:hypothetical protein
MWTCPKCRSRVDDAFEVCWSCGTSAEGEEDPTFARADDVGPAPDQPCKPAPKREDDLEFEVAEPAPEIEVVDCYWAGNPSEAMFLAGQLLQQGIPAAADTHNLQIVFAGFFGLVPAGPYFGPRVRVLANDLPRARSWLAGFEERRAKRAYRHN